MTRRIHEFADPERFIVGTVGMPGERTFFLQARAGNEIISVVVEKQQAELLAERIDLLLDQVHVRHPELDIPPTPMSFDTHPLDVPIVEEFRVGSMALGWDESSERVVLEAHAATDEEQDLPEIGDDDPGAMDTLRVWLDAVTARAFAARARSVVAAGRPACPFCNQPLDPSGHICPRANGYRRRA